MDKEKIKLAFGRLPNPESYEHYFYVVVFEGENNAIAYSGYPTTSSFNCQHILFKKQMDYVCRVYKWIVDLERNREYFENLFGGERGEEIWWRYLACDCNVFYLKIHLTEEEIDELCIWG